MLEKWEFILILLISYLGSLSFGEGDLDSLKKAAWSEISNIWSDKTDIKI